MMDRRAFLKHAAVSSVAAAVAAPAVAEAAPMPANKDLLRWHLFELKRLLDIETDGDWWIFTVNSAEGWKGGGVSLTADHLKGPKGLIGIEVDA